jgi:hypothetical protein
MKAENINTLEELKEIAKSKFILLKSNKSSRKGFVLELPFENYTELHYLIFDIINVTLLAIRAAEEEIDTVKSPLSAIHGVLEILKHMIPLEEIQLLDVLHDIVINQENQTKHQP